MKRITTITMMLLVTGLANAQQQLSNGGFELWDTIGDYSQPTNWFTLNPLVAFTFEPSTTITNDAHTGSYAVQLESLTHPFGDLSGVLSTGPILNSSLQPDFSKVKMAFTDKPHKLEFYYKSYPMDGDTCVVSMNLTRWNSSTQSADTIASATQLFYDSIGTYTLASITVEYFSNLQPDSMFVIASSSLDGFNPTEGSRLLLDDMRLVYLPTGVKKEQQLIEAFVYPNPAQDKLTIKMQQAQIGTVYVYDLLGNIVHQQLLNGNELSIATSNMKDGLYMILLQTENGITQSYKVAVKK